MEVRRMYRALVIDFEIPQILEDGIHDFLKNLNENDGTLADCYEQDIRNTLNCCDDCLTKEQDKLLRDYYVRGGIYVDAGKLPFAKRRD